jgi:hypothetical protein
MAFAKGGDAKQMAEGVEGHGIVRNRIFPIVVAICCENRNTAKPDHSLRVVPAQAGTHTPGTIGFIWDAGANNLRKHDTQWL